MNPSSTSEFVAEEELDDAPVRDGFFEEEAVESELDDAPVRDGFLEEEAVESEFDDRMFDTDSSMSDTGSVDIPPEYVDAGMSDEQDVDYEPNQDVSKRRRKGPLKDFVYSDDEADDEDDDEEGEKETKKLPVSSAEAVAEKVPERRIPADEPAKKKKPTKCPECGVGCINLARHIKAKHQAWSKVKAQNARYMNIETKRKRVECPTCLTRVVNLKRHLVKMHDVQPGSMQELHLLAPTSKRAQTKLKLEVDDGFFDDTDDRAIRALFEDSTGDDDPWSVWTQEYVDQVDDASVGEEFLSETEDGWLALAEDDEDDDEEGELAEQPAKKKTKKLPDYSDEEEDDHEDYTKYFDEDDEGEPAEQPAKKKTKKLPDYSDEEEHDDEDYTKYFDDDEEGEPAEQPANMPYV
ncbi:hypothetical protein ACOMHN_059122 [Nucella lapillus]